MLGRVTFPEGYADAARSAALAGPHGGLPRRAGWYASRAVLGGELAVPCTCNPLQQG